MKKDINNEAYVYELIEKYSFNDLDNEQQELVLNRISREEYDRMRNTMNMSTTMFDKHCFDEEKPTVSLKNRILFQKMELWKVAAVFIFLLGAMWFSQREEQDKTVNTIAIADTVFIKKIDTLYITLTDTIERYIETIVYKEKVESNNFVLNPEESSSADTTTEICSKDICPDDAILMSRLKNEGNVSNDRSLMSFVVSMN